MLRGVFPVLSTPFLADGSPDECSLIGLVKYCADAGATGVVYPAIASEFATLTLAERHQLVACVLAQAGACGLQSVIGVSSASPTTSADLAQRARDAGATALMLMAPRSAGTSAEQVAAFFRASLGEEPSCPVILQNAPPPLGSALPISTVLNVLAMFPAIRYVKEENMPCGQRISQLLEGRPTTVWGVMGGAGGRFAVDEYIRGACGSMPSCELVEAHVAIWAHVNGGNVDAARKVLHEILPLLNMGFVFRQSAVKRLLLKRGLIQSDYFRDRNPSLDEHDGAEMDWIYQLLRHQMTATSSQKEQAPSLGRAT